MFYNSDKLFYNDSHKSGMDASPIHTGFFYLENKQITWISPRTEDGLTARAGENTCLCEEFFMATTYTIDLSQLKWDDADGQFSIVDAAVTVGGAQYALAAAGTEITLVSATAPTVTLGTLTATVDDELRMPPRYNL